MATMTGYMNERRAFHANTNLVHGRSLASDDERAGQQGTDRKCAGALLGRVGSRHADDARQRWIEGCGNQAGWRRTLALGTRAIRSRSMR